MCRFIDRLLAPPGLRDSHSTWTSFWEQASGSRVRLSHPGDALGTLLLSGNSTLTLGDMAGQTTGLTVTGQPSNSLSIAVGSDLLLEAQPPGRWLALRGRRTHGGDHIADLQNYIAAGEFTFTSINGGGYSLSSDGTYTYINVVPEPSSLLMIAATAGR